MATKPRPSCGLLAGKQLVYLERYWKMYLPGTPLLSDTAFFGELLASTAGD